MGAALHTTRKLYADKAAIKEIGERVLDMSGGVSTQPIAEGEPIPIPPKASKQIIRIVHDWRLVSTIGIRRPQTANLEAFDESAVEMVEETLYDGSTIRTIAPRPRLFSTAHLQRSVFYARSNAAGTGLVGIQSTNFVDIDSDDRYVGFGLYNIPDVTVGERYCHNWFDDWLGKITMAEILEPYGSMRSNAGRRGKWREKEAKEEADESWLPHAKPALSQ